MHPYLFVQLGKDLEIEAALKGFKDRNIRLEQELNKWKHDAYGLKVIK